MTQVLLYGPDGRPIEAKKPPSLWLAWAILGSLPVWIGITIWRDIQLPAVPPGISLQAPTDREPQRYNYAPNETDKALCLPKKGLI